MSNYKYINPIDRGFIKFKLTKKQHNEVFKNRKLKWHETCEYFYNDNSIKVHKFIRPSVVLLNTILLPISLIFVGLGNVKDLWQEVKRMYNQKKTGAFVSEFVYKSEKRFNQIMEIINKK